MEWAHKVVTRIPLDGLWNDTGPVAAERIEAIGGERVRALLREDAPHFVIANPGLPLRWVTPSDRFRFWKEEVAPRLVEPESSRFRLESYPGESCYTASEWKLLSGGVAVLLEMHH